MSLFEDRTTEKLEELNKLRCRMSQEYKKQRELWVVDVALKSMSASYYSGNLRPETEEASIVDVWDKNEAFQVKESLDKGRRRTKEIIDEINFHQSCHSEEEAVEFNSRKIFTPRTVSIEEIIETQLQFISDHSSRYCPSAKQCVNLVIYVNDHEIWDTYQSNKVNFSFELYGWKSVILTRGPWTYVIAASESATYAIRHGVNKLYRLCGKLPELDDYLLQE